MNLIHRHIFINVALTWAAAVKLFGFVLMLGWFDNDPGLRSDLLVWLPNLRFQALGQRMIYRIDR